MELVGTAINAVLISAVGVLLRFYLGGRFDDMSKRFEEKFDENEKEHRRIEAKVDEGFQDSRLRFESIQRSMDTMRSDLTNVALAVGAKGQAGSGG